MSLYLQESGLRSLVPLRSRHLSQNTSSKTTGRTTNNRMLLNSQCGLRLPAQRQSAASDLWTSPRLCRWRWDLGHGTLHGRRRQSHGLSSGQCFRTPPSRRHHHRRLRSFSSHRVKARRHRCCRHGSSLKKWSVVWCRARAHLPVAYRPSQSSQGHRIPPLHFCRRPEVSHFSYYLIKLPP